MWAQIAVPISRCSERGRLDGMDIEHVVRGTRTHQHAASISSPDDPTILEQAHTWTITVVEQAPWFASRQKMDPSRRALATLHSIDRLAHGFILSRHTGQSMSHGVAAAVGKP